MKICPECAFANEERFPACLWCNALLTGVRSTPSPDPSHPEHARARRDCARHARHQRRFFFAVCGYVLLLTLLTILPGAIFRPPVWACFAASGCAVAVAMGRGWLGTLGAMFVQGAFSTALLLGLGLGGVFTGFMLLAHIVQPAVFALWLESIEDGHG